MPHGQELNMAPIAHPYHLPTPPPLDTRVLDVPRHQLWRHQQLANSLLSSVNSLLDAFAVHVPAAAALVRRFEAWESLPQDVTQPAEHDILVPDAEQGRYELHDLTMSSSSVNGSASFARTCESCHLYVLPQA